MVLLMASNNSRQLFTDLLPWLLVLLGVVMVGAAAVYVVRRMMTKEQSGSGRGFTLQNLREMRARGELNEEEFQRARAAIVGDAEGRNAPPGSPKPPTATESGP